MFNFSTTHLFAVAGFAALLATAAQAFDGGSPAGLMNRQIQPVSLPTDVQREVRPTRTMVDDPTGERAGTITIDTKNRYLYLSMEGGRAMRYDVGVGREGCLVRARPYRGGAEWPLTPPPPCRSAARICRGREGGPPIRSAPAPFISTTPGDTMFRIHGTNEPDTIGCAVSSGCIRL
jgi:lipoprotein-anchoring transpeptidase ErfK/SrfK